MRIDLSVNRLPLLAPESLSGALKELCLTDSVNQRLS
jgi:hypothetical protein